MNTTPILVAFDPGFTATGVAAFRLGLTGDSLIALTTIETVKASKKQNLLAVEDHLRRTREIFHSLRETISQIVRDADRQAMLPHRVVALAAESLSMGGGAGGAAVAMKMGLSWGALICAGEVLSLPLLQVSPQTIRKKLGIETIKLPKKADKDAPPEVKRQAERDRDAARARGKAQTEAEIVRRFPLALDIADHLNKADRKHVFDAAGVGIACLDSELIRLARVQAA